MTYYELDLGMEEDKLSTGEVKFNLGSGQLKNFTAGKVSLFIFFCRYEWYIRFLG